MIMDVHIARKTLISAFLLMALMAELTILTTVLSAQDYTTGPASVPSPISAGSAINSGGSGASIAPIGPGHPSQVLPNASLVAVPVVGAAPLTVDFSVGLANTSGSLLYEWNFGDSANLPACRTLHAPRLPESRYVHLSARIGHSTRDLNNCFHEDNRDTPSRLGLG